MTTAAPRRDEILCCFSDCLECEDTTTCCTARDGCNWHEQARISSNARVLAALDTDP